MNNKIDSVLLVCLGNICRSPTAEAVLRHRAEQLGVELSVDSAGTGAWHIGKGPDQRACKAAEQRGYKMAHLKARRVSQEDFSRFDLVLAMDQENLDDLRQMAKPRHHERIQLLLDFAPAQSMREVPDPYYGGAHGFELVLDLIEEACDGLLNTLER